ncbi:MAG: hypothetical protein J6M92_13065 [Oribacterium sp.]|nr:hypothetical protein [Oribacterium sp.]
MREGLNPKVFLKIITIDVQKLFEYYPKKKGEEAMPFCFDTRNRYYYQQVVKQTADFDECPLYHQILKSKTFEKSNADIKDRDDWLLDKLVILDMSRIFRGQAFAGNEDSKRSEKPQEKVKVLMEEGLDIIFEKGRKAHMFPFDKSGNMSRKSRITFINEDYYDELNERLNLGIDFSKISVTLSKYYAYRGLYLTSSKRIVSNELKITPETLVILKDERTNKAGTRKVLGPSYERNVPVVTAKDVGNDAETDGINAENVDIGTDAETQKWKFTKTEVKDLEYVETPFDGVGIVSPEYAGCINNALGVTGASSFQVRMPFVKGMLHQVDFKGFISKYDKSFDGSKPYGYEDAFGIERDLKKAQILLTESMFKGFKWIKAHCDKKRIKDPMKFYCDAIRKYEHGLYISGTDLPYGHSEYTHLSYQMINTLDLTDEDFEKLIKKHREFIKEPKTYMEGWDSSEAYDYDETELFHELPAWKEAVFKDERFENDSYIASQLRNTRKGLITKIANGKLVVAGQTRFLCRDLLPLLANLLIDEKDAGNFYMRCLYMRFYLPVGKSVAKELKKYNNLKYIGYGAFFRSPHLSRNEQCLLQPFALPENYEEYIPVPALKDTEKRKYSEQERVDYKKKKYGQYIDHLNIYKKYFGHLTGVVMVPRGSIVPLCLGGADFDGDLVNIIYDDTVVKAVRRGCYINGLFRKLPVIKIPSTKADETKVPGKVPYQHIKDTFSNAIGYLSNSAISIGQTEYEHVKSANSDNDPEGNAKGNTNDEIPGSEQADNRETPACWMCTILTGLEIDAAKNGKHPDLSIILDNKENIGKAEYLRFREFYDALRSIGTFDDMTIKEKDDSIIIGNGEIKSDFYFPKGAGTMINRLPGVFAAEYNARSKEKEKKQNFSSPFKKSKNSKDVKEFIADCKSVIELYSAYKFVAGGISLQKNKDARGMLNMSKMITKIYDEDNAADIYENVLPGLCDSIEKAIGDTDIKEIKDRINEKKWMYVPFEDRAGVLEDIIGKGFRTEELGADERQLLFDFKHRGYKMLWHILTNVNDHRIKPYEEIKDKALEKKTGYKEASETFTELDGKLDSITRRFCEENLTDTEERLYRLCLSELRRIITDPKLTMEDKIISFYKEIAGNPQGGRFFWDVFSWRDISECIDKKEGEQYAE